jgi:hypothetical protein
MNTTKTLAIVLCLLVVAAGSAWAGNPGRQGAAGATELLIPVGSRATALSGSMLAMVSGVDAIHWNPAGMVRSNSGVEVMFSNLQYIADINLNYLGIATKVGDVGSFGFYIRSLDFGDIPVTTVENPEGTGTTYSPTFLSGGITFSRAFTDRIYGGATVKWVSETIERTSASGVAFDLGVQYFSEVGLKLGVTLKNLGPEMSFDGADMEYFVAIPGQEPGSRTRPLKLSGATFELPSTLEIGAGYDYKVSEQSSIALSGSFQNSNFGSDAFRIGAEFSFQNQLFLRGGYSLLTENNTDNNIYGPTVGAGVKLPVEGAAISFDYAYRVTDFFDANQWFTLTVGF